MINGKKLTAWATAGAILLGILGFLGIKGGDFFVGKSEGVASTARIDALEKEFKEYKITHDQWAGVQLERLKDRFDNQNELVNLLRADVAELKEDGRRLEEKIDRLLAPKLIYPK